ncbi:cytosine/adenosine deaminases [Moorella thermoacetica Y72]|uniref:Cytosine/adenosine deaminases n=1 Tax=Moorella thermoacetica Y72 TaxID=1325331 RepID=A0A0S6UAL0_NEOTH|nr:cytosine/adenosine deaminases [Moorella thermoacetica Y72]
MGENTITGILLLAVKVIPQGQDCPAQDNDTINHFLHPQEKSCYFSFSIGNGAGGCQGINLFGLLPATGP